MAWIGGRKLDSREMIKLKYKDILSSYLINQSEETLYLSQILSKKILEHQIDPEEIVSLHKSVLAELIPVVSPEVVDSFDILLEIMMAYGFAYRENQSLRFKQMEIQMEMEFGANMQKTMLGTKIPASDFLDIGAISVPAKIMNGDYYHFVEDSNQCIRVAIADIIGKGIPAALCMSMIKFAVDSLSFITPHSPDEVLKNINRIVEKNINLGMFITMLYGSYDQQRHIFQYATAGHEPGIYYHCKNNSFSDLHTKGLILGIDSSATYHKFEKSVEIGDMIILLSDGVTETRTSQGFLERKEIQELITKYIHLPAQEIVDNIYKELEKLQQYELRDDFTMIILRRKV